MKSNILRKKTVVVGSNNFTNNVRKLSMFRNMTSNNLFSFSGNKNSFAEASVSGGTNVPSSRPENNNKSNYP